MSFWNYDNNKNDDNTTWLDYCLPFLNTSDVDRNKNPVYRKMYQTRVSIESKKIVCRKMYVKDMYVKNMYENMKCLETNIWTYRSCNESCSMHVNIDLLFFTSASRAWNSLQKFYMIWIFGLKCDRI